MDKTVDEVKRLQNCINDLISVLALAAIWGGSEPREMLGTLLDSLVAILRLDFAYACVDHWIDGSPIELVRFARRQQRSAESQEVSRALQPFLRTDQMGSRFMIPNPIGEGEVAIASFSLGLQNQGGVLLGGSRRSDFPTDIERLLLRVAANQGVIGLQEARRSGEQKRIAEALEERVAERTRQLTTVNEQLRRSQVYLAEAQRLSHTGSWAFNASEAIYWSEENFLMWGFDPQQGLPNRETVLQRMHPEDRDRVLTSVEKAIREKTDYAVDFRIVLPDGTVKHIHGLGHPVFSATGELVEVVGTQLDVTDRKRAEEERERLRQAQADLARASRVTSMGELTASLAHEVKQPIGAAATNARTCIRWLARDHPDIEEAREAAARVANDVSRAAEIISRVHLLFRGGSEPQESIELNEVIQEMILLLHSEATQYSISVRADLAPNLGQVMGDRVQLQQVMMNLIMNSIDAMKEVDNPRELNIASRRAESEQQLLVSVRDTGKGLPPQHAGEIFNAFFTTKAHGTGMGLRISRSIIESHGGRLWADANTLRGATFCFTLPLNPKDG
jgi:PAS domain S-box-containing protein